jgi:hypothetical protein
VTSISESIRKFHLYAKPREINANEVADDLQMRRPVSIRELVRRLNSLPTELHLTETITTDDALGGRAEMVLRSDGTYTFSGHMRATGFPSFAFHVSATVNGHRFQATAVSQGRVFGTDTPGDRQKNWNENGRNQDLRQNWLSLVGNATLTVREEHNLSGTLGTLKDVAVGFAEAVGIAAATGSGGLAAAIILADTLGQASKEPMPFPKLPLGMTISAGVLLVFGPSAIIPAIVVGGAAELLLRHRPLSDEEARFAAKVFGPTLPAREQIILTNALGFDNRPFVVPGFGGSFLVNLGSGPFDNPMGHVSKGVAGRLLIHELTHVWQAKRLPAMTYFCHGAFDKSYEPGANPNRPFSEAYGIEQQAEIVALWYADDLAFLNNELVKPNPDFSKKKPHIFDRYVNGNIRAGLI